MKEVLESLWIIIKEFNCNYHTASSSTNITDRILMRAAAVIVITAGCRLQGAASPSKTVITILIHTAACASRRA